jgi:hypothetical protein
MRTNLFPGAKRRRHEFNHPIPFSVEVQNEGSCTSTVHIYIYLLGVDWDNFNFSCDMRFAVIKVLSLKIAVL